MNRNVCTKCKGKRLKADTAASAQIEPDYVEIFWNCRDCAHKWVAIYSFDCAEEFDDE